MEKLVHMFLKIAALLIESGAEISRVEASLAHMCAAYGASEVHAYATTAHVILTVKTEDGIYTETRRPGLVNTNLDLLDRTNALVRRISSDAPSVEEIGRLLKEMPRRKYPWYASAVAQGGVAASFCVFFGGRTVAEFFTAFFIGVLLGCLGWLLDCMEANRLLKSFLLSFLSSLMAFFAVRLSIVYMPDHMIIGYIMNLIPGLGIMGALRDLFVGDHFTGIVRILSAVLLAAALAAGFVLTMVLFGGVA